MSTILFVQGRPPEEGSHADAYLRLVLGQMGITEVSVGSVEDDAFGGEFFAQSCERAEQTLADLAEGF